MAVHQMRNFGLRNGQNIGDRAAIQIVALQNL
jgi:hypothetical protein